MNKQLKPLKIYPKDNEPVASALSDRVLAKIGSSTMPLPELVSRFRNFYRDSYPKLFDMVVKQIWLEQKFTFDGVRKAKRRGNGMTIDKSFAFFMTGLVGISQKVLTNNLVLFSTVSYFQDFFPNFSDYDPFLDPEYFKFPYQHVTPDFLYVVREHHERLEMLNYAEEKKMTIKSFIEFAVNQAISYNFETGHEVYRVMRNRSYFIFIKKIK